MAASTIRANRSAPRDPGARIRAPELRGRGGWLNTAGPLSLIDLRGRFVLVDFWTSCCVNCLHALDELRPVEERFADCLTVVAVHSPKFAHEREHRTVVDAVERYGITHPVLDDPDLRTWEAYTARAWPTLVLIDPEGYIAAVYSGEGHAHAIAAVVEAGIARHTAAGTLRRGPSPAQVGPSVRTGLRFPGDAVVLPAGTVLVTDTARHSLVELAADPATGDFTAEIRRIGSGSRGLIDGAATAAGFAEPQGLCLLPAAVAEQVGYDVVVADTAAHALRGIRLRDGAVSTVAGTGSAGTGSASTGSATGLSSPWAVAWWRDRVWIALAGTHQLGTFDPLTGTVELVAGTTQEGLRDGALAQAWFAQPSALAVDPVADRLWVLDAESSALRLVVDDPEDPGALVVSTVVGTGLFDFGHRDGDLAGALFQHPLGIAVEPGGTVLVADTYNGALRRVDPVAGTVRTLRTGLVEPTAVLIGAAGTAAVVVESAAHRLTRVDPAVAERTVATEPGIVARAAVVLRAGPVRLDVRFVPPPGQHPDERSGPATALRVVATPPALLREGAGDGTDLVRVLVLDAAVGDGILHVSARASSCDIEGNGRYPACHLHQQDWGIPVVLDRAGSSELVLNLGGDR
jgi:DNA-binding beta-propeller fold protein YncE